MWFLGVGGYGFSGKDTFADILAERYEWKKHYMSEPLEAALIALDPFLPMYSPSGDVVGWEHYSVLHKRVGYNESKKNPEARRLLQILGTSVGRNMFGENCWVNIGYTNCKLDMDKGFNVALTGIRFSNELKMATKLHGFNVWIDRPGFGPVNGHVSDNSLGPSDFDLILRNDGSLEDLKSTVLKFHECLDTQNRTKAQILSVIRKKLGYNGIR